MNEVLLSANFLVFVAVTVLRSLENFITALIFQFYRQAEVPSTVILEQELDKTPGETFTAFLRGWVGRTLVRRPPDLPDLPDLLRRPCSTILWSSRCCVRDTLQTSRDASNLIESLSVVETLLLFVNLGSSCRKTSYLATFLDNHATKELLQGRMCRI